MRHSYWGTTKIGRCSMCGSITAKTVMDQFLCPVCIERYGCQFVLGAKTAERILCYTRLAKLRVKRILRSFLWWR